jgi:hypothetical protein
VGPEWNTAINDTYSPSIGCDGIMTPNSRPTIPDNVFFARNAFRKTNVNENRLSSFAIYIACLNRLRVVLVEQRTSQGADE